MTGLLLFNRINVNIKNDISSLCLPLENKNLNISFKMSKWEMLL